MKSLSHPGADELVVFAGMDDACLVISIGKITLLAWTTIANSLTQAA